MVGKGGRGDGTEKTNRPLLRHVAEGEAMNKHASLIAWIDDSLRNAYDGHVCELRPLTLGLWGGTYVDANETVMGFLLMETTDNRAIFMHEYSEGINR